MDAKPTVMRTWTGWIATDRREEYAAYIGDTGMADYLATAGNLGAWMVFRDLGDGRTEVMTVSLWDSRDSIRAFAGDDIELARYYPEDDEYLLERELTVKHYDVV
jgi:heme-degrading monooxygenase HmoA